MKHLEEFIIPLTGNKDIQSEFNFTLKQSFFQQFNDNEIVDCNIVVEMNMRKGVGVYEMNFELNGEVTIKCDRCLEDLSIEIDHQAELVVKRGEKFEEIDDKVVNIAANDEQIDIAPFVYEYAKLALPLQRMHPEQECDQDMIDQMQKYQRSEEEEKETDTRWSALADLKDKLKENE